MRSQEDPALRRMAQDLPLRCGLRPMAQVLPSRRRNRAGVPFLFEKANLRSALGRLAEGDAGRLNAGPADRLRLTFV